MLTIRKENFRDDEINVILDGLVPENHLVRKIENAIDFSFIYDKVKDLRFTYEYPEEMEQKIILAMKAGDEKTAGQCMMQVFDRNLSGKVKANTYQCLIFDMIGTH